MWTEHWPLHDSDRTWFTGSLKRLERSVPVSPCWTFNCQVEKSQSLSGFAFVTKHPVKLGRWLRGIRNGKLDIWLLFDQVLDLWKFGKFVKKEKEKGKKGGAMCHSGHNVALYWVQLVYICKQTIQSKAIWDGVIFQGQITQFFVRNQTKNESDTAFNVKVQVWNLAR